MTATLYGIRNCDTVKKARVWLDDHGVGFAFHDFNTAGIEAVKLADWCDRAGWETVINRAGTTFRKLPESDRADLTRDRAVALMLAQPSMIKRPVVEADGALLIGFKPDAYAAAFAGAQ